MKFCHNKSCQMHKDVSNSVIQSRCYTFISEFTHKRVELYRHKCTKPNKDVVFLCSMCKGVLEVFKNDKTA